METLFNTQDAPSAKQATCYVTINDRRYNMLNAKDFKATAKVETKEVTVSGTSHYRPESNRNVYFLQHDGV